MESHAEPETGFCIVDLDHAREPQSRTLDALANASAYNKWIFSIFAEFIGDRALEIGCGNGKPDAPSSRKRERGDSNRHRR